MQQNNIQDPTTLTLGQLLAHPSPIIKRNAMSILKTLQKQKICTFNACKNVQYKFEVCKEHLSLEERHYGQHRNDDDTFYCGDCERNCLENKEVCIHCIPF